METKETTHLLCSKPVYHAIRINESKRKQWHAEPINDNFRYYTVDPVWMNVRLFVFWFLWVMLIVVLIASVLSYCCLLPQTCTRSGEVFISNTTNT